MHTHTLASGIAQTGKLMEYYCLLLLWICCQLGESSLCLNVSIAINSIICCKLQSNETVKMHFYPFPTNLWYFRHFIPSERTIVHISWGGDWLSLWMTSWPFSFSVGRKTYVHVSAEGFVVSIRSRGVWHDHPTASWCCWFQWRETGWCLARAVANYQCNVALAHLHKMKGRKRWGE